MKKTINYRLTLAEKQILKTKKVSQKFGGSLFVHAGYIENSLTCFGLVQITGEIKIKKAKVCCVACK